MTDLVLVIVGGSCSENARKTPLKHGPTSGNMEQAFYHLRIAALQWIFWVHSLNKKMIVRINCLNFASYNDSWDEKQIKICLGTKLSTCWIEIQILFSITFITYPTQTNATYFFWLVFFGGTTTTLRRPCRFFIFFIFWPTTSFEGESTPFINERPKIWFSPSTGECRRVLGGFGCLASVIKVTQIMNKERSSSCMLCVWEGGRRRNECDIWDVCAVGA